MQRPLTIKTAVVFVLSLLLWVPLSMIGNLATERNVRQTLVVSDIAASSSGAQHIFGPILVVPYTEQWLETVDLPQQSAPVAEPQSRTGKHASDRNKPSAAPPPEQRSYTESNTLYFLPDQSLVKGALAVETKQRGLFKVRSYVLDASVTGRFNLPTGYGNPKPAHGGTLTFGVPYLVLSVADMRGVLEVQGVEWAGQRHDFEQGAQFPAGRVTGMHASLGEQAAPNTDTAMPFAFSLKLRGLEDLNFVPTGKRTRVELDSPWPHPSFLGRFLPDAETEEIGPNGFHAIWNVSALATNVVEQFHKCADVQCFDTFGLKLMNPINIYSMSERAIKYGFLFIGLSFAAIFLFEVVKKLPIHPAQYTLVGLALAMFFLLLLSLSEHLAFNLSYTIAAGATAGLIGFYLSAVLGGVARGGVAGSLLAGLFAALYGLLQSEDNALMLGSLLLFGLLALAMVVTRRIDWYRLTPPTQTDGQISG